VACTCAPCIWPLRTSALRIQITTKLILSIEQPYAEAYSPHPTSFFTIDQATGLGRASHSYPLHWLVRSALRFRPYMDYRVPSRTRSHSMNSTPI
jgi:hypothetical protein